jgi:hypothetical protein
MDREFLSVTHPMRVIDGGHFDFMHTRCRQSYWSQIIARRTVEPLWQPQHRRIAPSYCSKPKSSVKPNQSLFVWAILTNRVYPQEHCSPMPIGVLTQNQHCPFSVTSPRLIGNEACNTDQPGITMEMDCIITKP